MSDPTHEVRFRARDIYLPDPGEVLIELRGSDVLSGVEIARSQGPDPSTTYLVVNVAGLSRPVLVPADRILEQA